MKHKKRIISILLLIALILSYMPINIVTAKDTVVIGDQGSLPSGGIPNPDGGIVGIEYPTFVVSFTKEKFKNANVYTGDKNEVVRKKIQQQYNNHVPSVDNSIFFVQPNGPYKPEASISWYNESNGHLDGIGKSISKNNMSYKLRLLETPDTSKYIPVLFDILKAEIDKSKEGNKWALIGKWETIAKKNYNPKHAMKLWNYMLDEKGKYLNTRLSNFLKGDLDPFQSLDNRNQQACAWVEMMISLWQLSEGKQRDAYAAEIDRFLKNKDQYDTPSLIAITTAVLVHAPSNNPPYIYVKSYDYVEYIAGISEKYSLYKADKGLRENESYLTSGHKEMINAAILDSLKDEPKWNRVTYVKLSREAFNWGMGGILGYRIYTPKGENKVSISPSSVDNSAIELIKFSNNMYGFAIAYPYGGNMPEPCRANLEIKTNSPKEVNVGNSAVIGEDVTVWASIKTQEINDWESRIKAGFKDNYPKIQINLKRTEPSTREADKNSTPSVTDTNPEFISETGTITANTESPIYISPDELLKLLKGENAALKFSDKTSKYPIDYGQSIKFRYEATGTIWLSKDEEVNLNFDEPAKAEKTFTREGKDDIETIARYWSEIKNGSPGNEPFEAMAGVPTTRNLYFASGGSEFIVQFNMQYKKDAETERTYRSYFTGGIDSEFKAGDTAPNQSLGGQSANLHGGGTYTKTWTGSIPNNASAVTALHNATCPAQPDRSAYNAALAEANAFASEVNSTTLSFTCASDGETRSKTGWNATVSASPSDPQTTSASVACDQRAEVSHTETTGTPPNTSSRTVVDSPAVPCHNEMATASPGGAGSYTITVTWTVSAHCICGPCCTHVLEGVEDTWKQKIKYDHMKITLAKVWKLDQASLNGMTDITGTDEIKATVVSGDPNIFYNKAKTNTSKDGRLRYSLEPNQHDTVNWDEGPRSNKEDGSASNGVSSLTRTSACVENSINKSNTSYTTTPNYHEAYYDNTAKGSIEYKKFDERRKSQNKATVISDFLILQTSSGDQSIFYFQKDSTVKQSQQDFDKVEASEDEMDTDNPLSFFTHEELDAINIGSYNGKYYDPRNKYSQQLGNKVETKFDTVPAGLIRPARPGAPMRLVNTDIDIIDDLPNGLYKTGRASVFYKLILNEYDGEAGTATSEDDGTGYNTHFGDYGKEFIEDSNYSDNHTKINDIVIHNPVSAEYAMVIPLPAKFDQRTNSTKMLGGNIQEDTVELVTRLKSPLPKQNLIWNGDAEQSDSDGTLSNWKTWTSSPVNAIFTKRTTSDWRISGNSTFEIITTPNLNIPAVYYTDVPGIGGDSYSFTGKMGAHRCVGYFYIEAFNSAGTSLGTFQSEHMDNNATIKTLTINFKAPIGTTKLRVHIVNGNTSGYVAGYSEHVFADDLVLNDNTTTTWQTISYEIKEVTEVPNPDYVPEKTIPNPNYVPASAGGKVEFNYTGSYQTFTAPVTGTYVLEVYGAQGGTSSHCSTTNNYGGYSSGSIELSAGQTIYVYVGGSGSNSYYGGFNGGGSGYNSGSDSAGGGGGTDIRVGGNELNNRVIVAGGGGGNGCQNDAGGAGGGTNGDRGTGNNYGSPGSGGTQSSGGSSGGRYSTNGSLGQGGNVTGGYGGGGGGGGYYGGGAGYSDEGGGNAGGGGSGYIGGVVNGAMSSGKRSGNGYAVITSPATAAVGTPMITVPAKGTPTIKSSIAQLYTISKAPEDWYETVEVTIPANKPVTINGKGTFSPGNFINLDYSFQIYFPNKGDFEGDNCYGISDPSMMRGKGFSDSMNTTEWTKEKYVRFNFNTIYNGVGYSSGEDIPLDIGDTDGIYDFYCPLANYEAVSAGVQFKVIANNGNSVDNMLPANKERGSNFDAYHSGVKDAYIDIVGRIGNLVIEDTTDYRFANLFKIVKTPTTWIMPKVVKAVYENRQNNIVGSMMNIRGENASEATNWLNTYGLLDFLNREPISFPLTPDKNNLTALRRQPLRIGYKSLMDIQTTGNYSSGGMQIIPYYYVLNLKKGTITKVDVYMNVSGSYKPINIFGAAVPGWDSNMVYNNKTVLDWEDENQRRNYTADEKERTEQISEAFKTYDDGSGNWLSLQIPVGNSYNYGNNQLLQLTGRNRTFIGTSTTNGKIDTNPNNVFYDLSYGLQAQRWHFTSGLPSSAVFVEHGKPLTQRNIDAIKSDTSVVLVCLDIKAVGDTYILQYSDNGENASVKVAGKTYNLSSIPYPVVEIMSTNKSSADDLTVRGTH